MDRTMDVYHVKLGWSSEMDNVLTHLNVLVRVLLISITDVVRTTISIVI